VNGEKERRDSGLAYQVGHCQRDSRTAVRVKAFQAFQLELPHDHRCRLEEDNQREGSTTVATGERERDSDERREDIDRHKYLVVSHGGGRVCGCSAHRIVHLAIPSGAIIGGGVDVSTDRLVTDLEVAEDGLESLEKQERDRRSQRKKVKMPQTRAPLCAEEALTKTMRSLVW
jgi:hypothetical protein